MKMEAHALYIKRIVNGKETLFPSDANPVIISQYSCNYSRMGSCPTMEGNFMFPKCLDSDWTFKEFIDYDGERFYFSQKPSSVKDNESCLFKHTFTASLHREILDNILFFDVVSDEEADVNGGDVYRSNLTKFTFSGTLKDFVSRINHSLTYCGLYDHEKKEGYRVSIDPMVDCSETKELSFEDKYITEVLQEIHNTFGQNYFWVGKTCFVGEFQNEIKETIRYGANDALISISRENANYKRIDMITGHGSSDNIPFYYPNADEYGIPLFETKNFDKSLVSSVELGKIMSWDSGLYQNEYTLFKTSRSNYSANLFDWQKTYKMAIQGGLETAYNPLSTSRVMLNNKIENGIYYSNLGQYTGGVMMSETMVTSFQAFLILEFDSESVVASLDFKDFKFAVGEAYDSNVGFKFDTSYRFFIGYGMTADEVYNNVLSGKPYNGIDLSTAPEGMIAFSKSSDKKIIFDRSEKCAFLIECNIEISNKGVIGLRDKYAKVKAYVDGPIYYNFTPRTQYYWVYGDKNRDYNNSGITINEIESLPAVTQNYSFNGRKWSILERIDDEDYSKDDFDNAAKFRITGRKYIEPTGYLMPSIYRNSGGRDRFFYAKNDTYKIPETDIYYHFNNEYKKGDPHQGSFSYDDIKPTIKGVTNSNGELFGEIAEVAFDSNDSDIKKSDGETYLHQYFYIKLHIYDGIYGFNLFEQALPDENAVIQMIDSVGCPSCKFPIKCVWSADKNTCYNCVSVDLDGNLKAYSKDDTRDGFVGDYILSDTDAVSYSRNANTQTGEVWICVQKDTSTITNTIMPNQSSGFRPKKGDKFVITGIKMPNVLVAAAEKSLDDTLIKQMFESNDDKFTYTITFSRIFLQEHQDFAEKLNENTKLNIEYNGIKQSLYVSNYKKSVDENILEDIQVELVDELSASQGELRQEIENVKSEFTELIPKLVGDYNGVTEDQVKASFVSKLYNDYVNGVITFLREIKARYGININDGKFGINVNGDAKLSTIIADGINNGNMSIENLGIDGAKGYAIYLDRKGESHAYFDHIVARQSSLFENMEIRKVSYAGGSVMYSNAGNTISKVEYIYSETSGGIVAIKCYFKSDDGTNQVMNWWRVGMMAFCQTYNVANSHNKYYWRLVIGTGSEYLSDGALYGYVILSNVPKFSGKDSVIPTFYDQIPVRENLDILTWGSENQIVVLLGKKYDSIYTISEESVDDASTSLLDKMFFGYDSAQANDLPQIGDVIVQVGDQIKWKSRGNLVAIRTSTDDENKDNVPSITMYHSMGAPYASGNVDVDGNPIENPYQWKTKVSIESPNGWLINADRFKFFTGDDEAQIVEPISTTYEIVPNISTLTIHSDGTTTPTDYELTMYKHYGNKTENVTSNYFLYAVAKFGENTTDTYFLYDVSTWNAFLQSLPLVKSLRFEAYDGERTKGGALVTTYNIPILSDGKDGVDGKSVSIKGTLSNKSDLPTTGQTEGDGYIISGDLWTYTGTATEDDANHNGFTNVGMIQGPSGKDATQYYIYTAWMNTINNSDSSFTTNNPDGKAYKYFGTCISTSASQPSTWGSYKWSLIKGVDGKDGESVSMKGKVVDAIVDGELPDGSSVFSWEEVISSGFFEFSVGDIYLFWLSDGAGSKAQVVSYTTEHTYSIIDAIEGDCYVVNERNGVMGVYGHLYTCVNGGGYTYWKDMGMWHGLDGVTITATPGSVVFSTDMTGTVSSMSGQSNKITLTAVRGENVASLTIKSIDAHGCVATYTGAQITITSIDTEEVTLTDGTKKRLSVGGGYVTALCDVEGVSYYTSVGFSVNISAYASRVEWNAKQYNSTFESYKEYTNGTLQKMQSDITQTSEKISAKVWRNDMTAAGLDITEDTVILTATKTHIRNQKGDEVAVFNADGTMIAGSVETKNNGNGSISMVDGYTEFKNADGKTNIRIGLVGGYVVLQYFDNDGKLLYDMGPNGVSDSTMEKVQMKDMVAVFLTSGVSYTTKYLDVINGIWHDTAKDGTISYEVLVENSDTNKKRLRYYRAARINGIIQADPLRGFDTPEQAKKADGKWFVVNTIMADEKLTTLAESGYWRDVDVVWIENALYDNQWRPWKSAFMTSVNIEDKYPIMLQLNTLELKRREDIIIGNN